MGINDVTRTDLEQMFENQAVLLTKEVGRVEEKIDQNFGQIHDEIAELRVTIDRIDRRDNEDIQTIYREITLIKKHIGLEVQEEKITA